MQGYANGKVFMEAVWTGTPKLTLGQVFKSYSLNEPQPKEYECLSNEFTVGEGMRLKTKARQR